MAPQREWCRDRLKGACAPANCGPGFDRRDEVAGPPQRWRATPYGQSCEVRGVDGNPPSPLLPWHLAYKMITVVSYT